MAFQAMQAEDVGMVTSIEVAPWVEHSEFQDALQLDPKDVPDPADPTKKITRTPYEQKRILTQNSEFLSEVDRAARGKLNVYYRAKQCATGVKLDYKVLAEDGVTWSWLDRPDIGDWSKASVQNHRTSKWDRTLSDIENAVKEALGFGDVPIQPAPNPPLIPEAAEANVVVVLGQNYEAAVGG